MFDTKVDLITIDELCAMLMIGRGRAYELLNEKQIPAFKIGDVWKIPKRGVEVYILEQSGLTNKDRFRS